MRKKEEASIVKGMALFVDHLWHKIDQSRAAFPFLAALETHFPEGEIYLVGGRSGTFSWGARRKISTFWSGGFPPRS
ncbi:MAG: hypothetical protein MPW14_15185 [Candidatus Manganitrophus sp.]|nr:MAG: hypothetical protein MPW14_15185 [Candidatus Manganitrophus sp.]